MVHKSSFKTLLGVPSFHKENVLFKLNGESFLSRKDVLNRLEVAFNWLCSYNVAWRCSKATTWIFRFNERELIRRHSPTNLTVLLGEAFSIPSQIYLMSFTASPSNSYGIRNNASLFHGLKILCIVYIH